MYTSSEPPCSGILTSSQKKAQEEKSNPGAINLDRKLQNYLIYGHGNAKRFDTKQLTLTALTGMLKYMAKLKDLRVAHDKLGRLKRVKVPSGIEQYMTVQWDRITPFPTSESLIHLAEKNTD